MDANGVPTDALTYTFQTVKNNTVGVTVTLDPEYLTATDRAFPVVIDPTIMISSSSTADACVCSYTPSTNYQMATQLRTGFCTDYGIRRTYIKFNIPEAIQANTVTSARLEVEKSSGYTPTIRAFRVSDSWSSGTITWNNKPGFTALNASEISAQLSSGSSWYVMYVTEIVRQWVNKEKTNHGFVLVDMTENDPNHWTTWYSSDAVSPHKPELYITYSGPEIPSTPPTTTKGAVLLGVPVKQDEEDDHDHTGAFTTLSSILSGWGYTPNIPAPSTVNVGTTVTSGFSESTVTALLSNTTNKIFVSRSHGGILIDEGGSTHSTYLVINDASLRYYSDIDLNFSLSHMELVMFVGCETAYELPDNRMNLPQKAEANGARVAVGFKEQIPCLKANDWTVDFFELLDDGMSVGEALEELDKDTDYISTTLKSSEPYGDTTLTFN